MTQTPIDLDGRRGTVAQKATEQRRLKATVQAKAASVGVRQNALEALLDAPAADWPDAIDRVRGLLAILGDASADSRNGRLIARVLADCDRLLAKDDDPTTA